MNKWDWLNNIFFILFVFTITNSATACSCSNVPKTFMKSINSNKSIFHVKIIGQIQLNSFLGYDSYSKLEVINDLNGSLKNGDIIFFGNGNNANCGASISFLKIGEEAIIKANDESFKSLLIAHNFSDNSNKKLLDFFKENLENNIYQYHICDEWYIRIVNNIAIGNITKNLFYTRLRKLKFIGMFSKRWREKREDKWRESKKDRQQQKMRIRKVLRKIKRKVE